MGNTDDKKYYLKDSALTTVDDDFLDIRMLLTIL